MKIILEGNECNFKTTIAEKLSEKLNYNIVKGSSFEIAKSNNEEMFNHFVAISNMKHLVIDRFIYSNLVYASIYPNNTILTEEQVRFIENLINIQGNTLVVHLYSDLDTLKERLNNRGDEYIKVDELEEISDLFELLLGRSPIEYESFDTSIMNSDEIVEEILKLLKELDGRNA